ncbi:MAG: redox-sensing transcriptional repressor Rex [Planctomycetota bacterium]|jgi:redox-sensing transcriptional repressor|nr:redox-sensing transcriptional repressor Rex [Planctomycetota bacterium]
MSDANDKTSKDPVGVPKAVVSRLSLYLRELQHWQREGKETVSSTQLGRLLGFTDAQVRKDLAYFGQFGYPGIGYKCQELIDAIRSILGTDRSWPVALVGCGHLGRALMGYKGFQQQGFDIVAAFDSDPKKIGEPLGEMRIADIKNFPEIADKLSIRLVILSVPAAVAQRVVEALVDSGITGILNFAPVTLSLPNHVRVIGVDLAIEFEQLAFAVVKGWTSQ